MSSSDMLGVIAEIAHPYGEQSFVAPLKQRAIMPARAAVAYADDDDGGSNGAPMGDAPMGEAAAAADEVPDALAGQDSGKRKRIVRSVQLDHWADLDQETLPNGGQPVVLVDRRTHGKKHVPRRDTKLDEFGAVGETTVQLKTSRGDGGEFDQMLSNYAETRASADKEAKEAAAARAAGGPKPPKQGEATSKAAGKAAGVADGTTDGAAGGPFGRNRKLPSVGYVCARCRVPGHWREDCTAEIKPPDGYVCRRCEVPGHWVHECVNPQVEREEGAAPAKRPKVRGKPSAGYICKACNETGHFLEECSQLEAYYAGPPPSGYVCNSCKQAGHWIHNCATQVKWKENTAADGRQQAPIALVVDEEAREVGEDIAEALEEEEAEVVGTVQRVVAVLGEEAARTVLVNTWQVEESGGLLTVDGTNRRRTPGGVFLWLAKMKMSAEQRGQVFPQRDDKKGGKGGARRGGGDGEG